MHSSELTVTEKADGRLYKIVSEKNNLVDVDLGDHHTEVINNVKEVCCKTWFTYLPKTSASTHSNAKRINLIQKLSTAGMCRSPEMQHKAVQSSLSTNNRQNDANSLFNQKLETSNKSSHQSSFGPTNSQKANQSIAESNVLLKPQEEEMLVHKISLEEYLNRIAMDVSSEDESETSKENFVSSKPLLDPRLNSTQQDPRLNSTPQDPLLNSTPQDPRLNSTQQRNFTKPMFLKCVKWASKESNKESAGECLVVPKFYIDSSKSAKPTDPRLQSQNPFYRKLSLPSISCSSLDIRCKSLESSLELSSTSCHSLNKHSVSSKTDFLPEKPAKCIFSTEVLQNAKSTTVSRISHKRARWSTGTMERNELFELKNTSEQLLPTYASSFASNNSDVESAISLSKSTKMNSAVRNHDRSLHLAVRKNSLKQSEKLKDDSNTYPTTNAGRQGSVKVKLVQYSPNNTKSPSSARKQFAEDRKGLAKKRPLGSVSKQGFNRKDDSVKTYEKTLKCNSTLKNDFNSDNIQGNFTSHLENSKNVLHCVIKDDNCVSKQMLPSSSEILKIKVKCKVEKKSPQNDFQCSDLTTPIVKARQLTLMMKYPSGNKQEKCVQEEINVHPDGISNSSGCDEYEHNASRMSIYKSCVQKVSLSPNETGENKISILSSPTKRRENSNVKNVKKIMQFQNLPDSQCSQISDKYQTVTKSSESKNVLFPNINSTKGELNENSSLVKCSDSEDYSSIASKYVFNNVFKVFKKDFSHVYALTGTKFPFTFLSSKTASRGLSIPRGLYRSGLECCVRLIFCEGLLLYKTSSAVNMNKIEHCMLFAFVKHLKEHSQCEAHDLLKNFGVGHTKKCKFRKYLSKIHEMKKILVKAHSKQYNRCSLKKEGSVLKSSKYQSLVSVSSAQSSKISPLCDTQCYSSFKYPSTSNDFSVDEKSAGVRTLCKTENIADAEQVTKSIQVCHRTVWEKKDLEWNNFLKNCNCKHLLYSNVKDSFCLTLNKKGILFAVFDYKNAVCQCLSYLMGEDLYVKNNPLTKCLSSNLACTKYILDYNTSYDLSYCTKNNLVFCASNLIRSVYNPDFCSNLFSTNVLPSMSINSDFLIANAFSEVSLTDAANVKESSADITAPEHAFQKHSSILSNFKHVIVESKNDVLENASCSLQSIFVIKSIQLYRLPNPFAYTKQELIDENNFKHCNSNDIRLSSEYAKETVMLGKDLEPENYAVIHTHMFSDFLRLIESSCAAIQAHGEGKTVSKVHFATNPKESLTKSNPFDVMLKNRTYSSIEVLPSVCKNLSEGSSIKNKISESDQFSQTKSRDPLLILSRDDQHHPENVINSDDYSLSMFQLFKSDCSNEYFERNLSEQIIDKIFLNIDLFKEDSILYQYYKHLKKTGCHEFDFTSVIGNTNNLSQEKLLSYNFLTDQLNYHKSVLHGLVQTASDPRLDSDMALMEKITEQLEFIEGYELACKAILL